MRPVRDLPALVVLVVVAVSALLGGGVADYPSTAEPRVGTGNATVEVASTPATVRLERARFGAGTYRLSGDPAVVRVGDLRGNPELTYTLDVPGLELSHVAHYPLAGREGRVTLTFDPVEISPDLVDRERYDATVAVWLRTGDQYRNLAQERVTVEVEHE